MAAAGGASATRSKKRGREQGEQYAWERDYERRWDDVVEDEHGRLIYRREAAAEARRRRAALSTDEELSSVRRRLLRAVLVVLDLSAAMRETDLRPSRAHAAIAALQDFVRDFFDRNPISYMGIAVMCDHEVKVVSSPASTPKRHLDALASLLENLDTTYLKGGVSFLFALELAAAFFRSIPAYAEREVVLIHGALRTNDRGDLLGMAQECVAAKIRVSMLGLGGEVFVARKIAEVTGGTFAVPLDLDHLREVLGSFRTPRAETLADAPVGRMEPHGFPRWVRDEPGFLVPEGRWSATGYACPRCSARVADIPIHCPICHLRLLASTHLARSYHHLFPVRHFIEVPPAQSRAWIVLRDPEFLGPDPADEDAILAEVEARQRAQLAPLREATRTKATTATTTKQKGVSGSEKEEKGEGKGEGKGETEEEVGGAEGGEGEDDGVRVMGKARRGGRRMEATRRLEVLDIRTLHPEARAARDEFRRRSRGRRSNEADALLRSERDSEPPTIAPSSSSSSSSSSSALAPSRVLPTRAIFAVFETHARSCGACHRRLNPKEEARFVCRKCRWTFCGVCDEFIHDSLHNCPGCA